MVDFQRLMRGIAGFCFGVFCAALPMLAFADDYSATQEYYTAGKTAEYGYHLTPQALCDAYAAYEQSAYTYSYSAAETRCYTVINGTTYWGAWVSSRYVCPYGGTLNGTQCLGAPACPEGQVRNVTTGKCEAPPDGCAASAGDYWNSNTEHWGGKPWEGSMYSGSGSTPDSGCVNGCQVTFEFDTAFGFSGGWSGFGYAKNSGTSCVSQPDGSTEPPTTEAKPKTSPEYDCAAAGQTWGTVNGTVVCTGEMTEKTTESTKTTTKTNPDNSTETSTETTECQGETCTKTTETTTCDAQGNCTTQTGTETTTPSDGPGGNGTGEAPESKWGGQCESGFACSGDAIQCAISLEIHKQGCALAVADEHKTRGQNYLNGQLDADDPRAPANKTTAAMGTWSEEGGMSGSCPADWSTTLMGQQIVVPWSGLCPHFEAMGYAMLAIAWVIAASILRGVL